MPEGSGFSFSNVEDRRYGDFLLSIFGFCSFCFTVLDQRDRMFFIKGDNPLCLYHWHNSGVYLYASTEEILKSALAKLRLPLGRPERIELDCGDILCIDRDDRQSRGGFDPSKLLACQRFCFYPPYALHFEQPTCSSALNSAYLHDMKQVARCYGIEPETIDELLRDGFTFDELEELIYAGEI